MNIFEKILVFLDSRMETPTIYGWFHLLFLIALIVITILICKKNKELDNQKLKKILLISSTIMIIFEIYKQINFSFNYEETKTWWEYQWYAFPFQFCSTPMYVALVAGLTKNKKIEKICYSFLATYGLVGGVAVMLYPSTVFISTIGISIQTMVHHGLMVIMGLVILIKKKVPYNFETIKDGLKMFLVLVFIAVLANIITYYLNINDGLELFYISPYHTSTLPIFEIIYKVVPYPIFLLIYILIFTIGSNLSIFISRVINKFLTK